MTERVASIDLLNDFAAGARKPPRVFRSFDDLRRAAQKLPPRRELEFQVSGNACFSERRWREAILYYLFGVWAGQQKVMYRPKISFGPITLRLAADAGEYYAHAWDRQGALDFFGVDLNGLAPAFPNSIILRVGYTQVEVEQGLVRFVKNNRVKLLVISLREGEIRLWKMQERSRLGISATGLPTQAEIALR